jgi:hypothetical protein
VAERGGQWSDTRDRAARVGPVVGRCRPRAQSSVGPVLSLVPPSELESELPSLSEPLAVVSLLLDSSLDPSKVVDPSLVDASLDDDVSVVESSEPDVPDVSVVTLDVASDVTAEGSPLVSVEVVDVVDVVVLVVSIVVVSSVAPVVVTSVSTGASAHSTATH